MINEKGTRLSCAPYKCNDEGTCKLSCKSVDDCSADSACGPDGRCISAEAVTNDSSCGAAGRPGGEGAGALTAALALAGMLAARRRRGEGRA